MPKNKNYSAGEVIALTSTYMNSEHVAFVKKLANTRPRHMRVNLENLVKNILFTLSKWQQF